VPEPAAFRDRPLSFVRRNGRMTDGQERAWTDLAPRYVIDPPRGDAATSVRAGASIDPREVWGREAPLIAEIGSGQGHAIVHAASAHPEVDFLAIEVFTAGLARTMLNAERAGARNLRLVEANAPEVLAHLLPPASLDELWIFFPDPWHKNKHNKRRLVTPEFAATAAGAVRDGGVVRIATDWEQYARQMRDVMDAAPAFARAFAGEWAERFDGRVLTAFERKGARAGRAIRDLAYVRRPRG
jgi:tRNA (guanine-N7-)-methyltransferase